MEPKLEGRRFNREMMIRWILVVGIIAGFWYFGVQNSPKPQDNETPTLPPNTLHETRIPEAWETRIAVRETELPKVEIEHFSSLVRSDKELYLISNRVRINRQDPFPSQSRVDNRSTIAHLSENGVVPIKVVSNLTSNLAPDNEGGLYFATASPEASVGADLWRLNSHGETAPTHFPWIKKPIVEIALSSRGEFAIVDSEQQLYITVGDTVKQIPGQAIGTPVWSPSGEKLAYGLYQNDPDLRVTTLILNANGILSGGLTPSYWTENPQWSSDARYIAIESGPHLVVSDLEASINQTQRVGTDQQAFPNEAKWSPSESSLAYVASTTIPGKQGGYILDKSGVYLFKPGQGQKNLYESPDSHFLLADLTWSPDGKSLHFIENSLESSTLKEIPITP